MSTIIRTINNDEYIEAVSLQKFINELEEGILKNILYSFSCKRNLDVESFIRNKAIEFEKSNISRTYLFMRVNQKGKNKIIGYVSVGEQPLDVSKLKLSNTKKKRVMRKSHNIDDMRIIKTFLLGQVARNDKFEDKMFDLKMVMDFTIAKADESSSMFPYQFISVECEKILIDTYKQYGFEYTEIKNEEKGLFLMVKPM